MTLPKVKFWAWIRFLVSYEGAVTVYPLHVSTQTRKGPVGGVHLAHGPFRVITAAQRSVWGLRQLDCQCKRHDGCTMGFQMIHGWYGSIYTTIIHVEFQSFCYCSGLPCWLYYSADDDVLQWILGSPDILHTYSQSFRSNFQNFQERNAPCNVCGLSCWAQPVHH